MKALLGISLALLLSGCTKSEGPSGSAEKAAPELAAAPAQQPGAVAFPAAPPAPGAPTATLPAPAAEAEGGSCGGGGSCCGGGGGSCCGGAGVVETEIPSDAPADAAWSTVQVSGMRCSRCAKKIMAALGKVEGVLAVQVDHASGQVRWAVAKGHSDLRDGVTAEISKLGYQPQL